MAEEKQPIIIKKVIEGGHGHHGGAWKVAYADFVTALMALFIVLWILGQDDSVKQKIAGYFNDPSGFAIGTGPTAINGNNAKHVMPKELTEAQRRQMEKERLDKMGKELMDKLSSKDFDNIADQVEVEFTNEGLRIELIESSHDAFFEVGTAKLEGKAKQILTLIGKELAKHDNKIVIEGHTDARPFPGGRSGYSNYELSADRANAARRALLEAGVKEKNIDEIRGYAANRLRNKDNPYDVVNRRISIIVKYSTDTKSNEKSKSSK